MAYAFIHDVPADEEMYRHIAAPLPRNPEGLILHLVTPRAGGLRYIDVWESEGHWQRFHDEHAEPSVARVLASHGLPLDPSLATFEELEIIDLWRPEASGSEQILTPNRHIT